MNVEWNIKIEEMKNIINKLKEADQDGLYQYFLPEGPALDKEIEDVEKHLGHPLDVEYKNFLKCANGWKGFKQTVDLFGTSELLNLNKINTVNITLNALDNEGVLESLGLTKNELLPLAVASDEIDIFLMTNNNSRIPGRIIWFAGYEIERYENFEQFF